MIFCTLIFPHIKLPGSTNILAPNGLTFLVMTVLDFVTRSVCSRYSSPLVLVFFNSKSPHLSCTCSSLDIKPKCKELFNHMV